MDAGPPLPQHPWGGHALKRSFPQLQPADAAMVTVMGLPTSSPQKEKAVAFLWDQRADQEGDWERKQGMGGREGGPEEDKARFH